MGIAKKLAWSVVLATTVVAAGLFFPWNLVYAGQYRSSQQVLPIFPRIGERIVISDSIKGSVELQNVERVVWLPACSTCSASVWKASSFDAIKGKPKTILITIEPISKIEKHYEYKGLDTFYGVYAPHLIKPEHSMSPESLFGARLHKGVIVAVAYTKAEVLAL